MRKKLAKMLAWSINQGMSNNEIDFIDEDKFLNFEQYIGAEAAEGIHKTTDTVKAGLLTYDGTSLSIDELPEKPDTVFTIDEYNHVAYYAMMEEGTKEEKTVKIGFTRMECMDAQMFADSLKQIESRRVVFKYWDGPGSTKNACFYGELPEDWECPVETLHEGTSSLMDHAERDYRHLAHDWNEKYLFNRDPKDSYIRVRLNSGKVIETERPAVVLQAYNAGEWQNIFCDHRQPVVEVVYNLMRTWADMPADSLRMELFT